jgi:hypothetical protein
MIDRMNERYAGGCLCGAVRYTMAALPTSTNICYCRQCQRQSGAPMPAFASCLAEQLTIDSGQAELASYRSSERAVRQFCALCGSTLFWREDGGVDVDIFLGTFDEPSRLPPPQYAIWAAHRISWLTDLQGIPTYPARRQP